MNYLGLTLLWCAVQVTIFATVSAVLYLSMRRHSPAARSTVLAASLVSIALLTGLAWSPWPRWVSENSAGLQSSRSAGPSEVLSINPVSVAEIPDSGTPRLSASSGSTAMLFLQSLWDEMKHAPVQRAEEDDSAWSWQSIVASLFLAVFGLGFVRLMSGILAVRRYRSQSHPIDSAEMISLLEGLQLQLECRRPIGLRVSSAVSSPATIGWRKPLILLPVEWEEWNDYERMAVIAHEVAHIKRFDFPTWFAAQVGVVLHFYHPIVHWLAGRLRLEQELAADAAAAETLGGNSNYLSTLAGMALRRDDRTLSWAARTFLPSRHTFIRRIEMLRRRKVLAIRLSTVGRTLLAGLLFAAAVFAAGWRSPFEEAAVAQQPATTNDRAAGERVALVNTQATAAAEQGTLSLAFVPRDSLVVVAGSPAKLLAQPVFALIKQSIDAQDGMQEVFGIDIRTIRQLTLAFLPGERPGFADDPTLVIHFDRDVNQQELLSTWLKRSEEHDLGGLKYYTDQGNRRSCAFPDARTAIVAQNSSDLIRALAADKESALKANWITAWNRVSGSDAAAMFDFQRMQAGFNEEFSRGPRAAMMKSFSPLWQDGARLVWGINAAESFQLKLYMECHEGTADQVHDTMKAGLVLARNGLSALRAEAARQGGQNALMALKAADIADEVLDQVKIEVKDDTVQVNLELEDEAVGGLIAMVLPAVQAARTAARRAQSMNNLKQIGLAMHNYHDTYKRFPAAVMMGPDGKTPHSWRVAILPFVAEGELYKQYRMDEPWDSEHNKQLLEKIPDVYRSPMDGRFSTNTSYFALTGKQTAFESEDGQRLRDFTDGLSNTLLVAETKKAVAWTKPDDIPIDIEQDLPEFGGWYDAGFIGLFGDGSVRFLSESMDKNVLKMLITRNGGEVIPRD